MCLAERKMVHAPIPVSKTIGSQHEHAIYLTMPDRWAFVKCRGLTRADVSSLVFKMQTRPFVIFSLAPKLEGALNGFEECLGKAAED